jgi:DNA-binding transcriptional LysR family regulator
VSDITELNAFIKAAEFRSFTVAGYHLGISPSTVGKAIARLEQHHGVRLFHRTTRSLSLTREGQLFLDSCRRIIVELNKVEREFARTKDVPTGRLRVSLPFGLATCVSAFKCKFPEIELEIDIDDGLVNVVDAGVDVAVRVGGIDNSRLMARKIGSYRLELVASPRYLDRCSRLQCLADLADHACLYLKNPISGKCQPWPTPDGRFLDTIVPVAAITNSIEALVAFAVQGMGIACVPDFAVGEQLADGKLNRVLGGCIGHVGYLKAVWASSKYLAPRSRAFIEFMAKEGLTRIEPVRSTECPPRFQQISSLCQSSSYSVRPLSQ